MNAPISFLQVIEHERLGERLSSLRVVADRARADGPDLIASATLAAVAAVLLRDIYRLISREPQARTLPRLDRRNPPTHRQLVSMLRDARLALDAFQRSHWDHDGEYGGDWLTREAIADASRRC